MTATTVARGTSRCQQSGKCAIFVQTEEQCDDDGQSATIEKVGVAKSIFRAKDK